MECWIISATAGLLFFLFWEKKQAEKHRAVLKHLVYVNGTRGKSTVTRLIAAALRAGGYRVFCKTTGTVATYIDTENREIPIRRRGRANIKEQLLFLRHAAAEHADIFVCECMAVDPHLQGISQHKMLCADIGVITNVRLDHTEEMGESLVEICDSLSKTIPKNGHLFTAEKELFPQLLQNATAVNAHCIQTLPDSDLPAFDFPENLALALAVAEQLGVSREVALAGMQTFKPDPFACSVFRLRNGAIFVNALSANDVQSSQMICQQVVAQFGLQERQLTLLINNRGDRGYRAEQMLLLAQRLMPRRVLLFGAFQSVMQKNLSKSCPAVAIERFKQVEALHLDAFTEADFIFAAGNIANFGVAILTKIMEEGERIG